MPLQVLFAFGVAMMLTRARQGVGFFRTVFYLPALVPPVAATLGFVYLLNPATGPVNTILGKLGIEGPLWFNDPTWSKPSLTLLGLWGDREHHDHLPRRDPRRPAAPVASPPQIDGAGPLQRLRWVTLPTISPVILFAVVIGVIARAAVLHAGLRRRRDRGRDRRRRPGQRARSSSATRRARRSSTRSSSTTQGFRYFNMGYASAMAMLLLGVALPAHAA